MLFFIRFWSNLNKKNSVESARYEIRKFLLVFTVLGRFFLHGSGSGFFRIRSGFSADPDPDR